MMINMTTTVNSTTMTIDRRKQKSIIHETTVIRWTAFIQPPHPTVIHTHSASRLDLTKDETLMTLNGLAGEHESHESLFLARKKGKRAWLYNPGRSQDVFRYQPPTWLMTPLMSPSRSRTSLIPRGDLSSSTSKLSIDYRENHPATAPGLLCFSHMHVLQRVLCGLVWFWRVGPWEWDRYV